MKKRKLFEKLLFEKDNRKISILVGSRQVGKTTILKALYEHICLNGNQKGLFLDLDLLANYEKVSTFENLTNTLRLNGFEDAQKEFFYLFLDEFQRYKDLSRVMKNVYDTFDNIKVYASGSSSLQIKDCVQESLAGRKILTVLYPLDFREFLWFKEEDAALKELENAPKLSGDRLASVSKRLHGLLGEFMVFGGYPEVVLQKENSSKMAVLENIFDLYVRKDLVEYMHLDKVLDAKRLVEYLAVNNGQKIKFDEACSASSLNFTKLKQYIDILKETYLISVIRPFFRNRNKELVKIPKVYFVDNGVRNYFVNNFNPLHLRDDSGFLFEGYCLSELLKLGILADNLKFWQDKNKHEVDIVIDNKQAQIPVEVKFKKTLKKEDFIGIRSFGEAYKPKNSFIINLGVQRKVDGISVMLPYRLALDLT